MIPFNIKDDHQIIVPIRFKRAITGPSERSAPEIDDRGFVMGTRPGGWGKTDARGPMVGLTKNYTVRIKVVREDIDDDAPLYVTCTNSKVMEVTEPANGGPLPNNGIFKIKGKTSKGAPGKIEVRLGSTTGPVLGELEPHVLGQYILPITPHLVRVDSVTTTGVRPNIPVERIINRARAIWWPCGIHTRYDSTTRPIVNDNIQLNTANRVRDNVWADITQVLGLQRQRLGLAAGTNDQSINWYIIQRFTDANTMGIGVNRQLANQIGCDAGVLTSADGVNTEAEYERVARTLAHEIGHFLTLKHVQERNADNPVNDTCGRRQLMFPLSFLPQAPANPGLMNTPRTNNVGYGNLVRGCLITMKNLSKHKNDGECSVCRAAIRNGTWY